MENGVVNIANRSRFPSIIICLEDAGEMAARLKREISIYELHKGDGIKPRCIFSILKLLKNERIALVHTHNWGTLCYAGPAAKLAGIKLIHGQHGLAPAEYPGRAAGYGFNLMVCKFVPVSMAISGKIKTAFGAKSKKIHPVINGVDTTCFRPDQQMRKKMRKDLGIDEDAYTLGFVGRLIDLKRPYYLPEIVKSLSDYQPPVHAVFIGIGPGEEKLCSLIRRLNVADRVHLLGFRSDMGQVLQALDILVLPSEDYEGTPNVVLEAMACGIPTVACSLSGLKDLLINGSDGILLPNSANPEDFAAAIHALIDTPARLPELSAACLRRCRRDFSLIRMIEEYDSIYGEILP
ncbi:MAG: glycosyltransferase [bacterium]